MHVSSCSTLQEFRLFSWINPIRHFKNISTMLLGIYQLFPSHLENLNDFSLAAMIKFEMEWNWTKHTQLFSRESELKALLMAVLWVVRIFIFSIVLFTIEWQLGANAEGGKYFIWSIQSLFSLAHLFCFIHFIVFSTGRSSGSIQMSRAKGVRPADHNEPAGKWYKRDRKKRAASESRNYRSSMYLSFNPRCHWVILQKK